MVAPILAVGLLSLGQIPHEFSECDGPRQAKTRFAYSVFYNANNNTDPSSKPMQGQSAEFFDVLSSEVIIGSHKTIAASKSKGHAELLSPVCRPSGNDMFVALYATDAKNKGSSITLSTPYATKAYTASTGSVGVNSFFALDIPACDETWAKDSNNKLPLADEIDYTRAKPLGSLGDCQNGQLCPDFTKDTHICVTKVENVIPKGKAGVIMRAHVNVTKACVAEETLGSFESFSDNNGTSGVDLYAYPFVSSINGTKVPSFTGSHAISGTAKDYLKGAISQLRGEDLPDWASYHDTASMTWLAGKGKRFDFCDSNTVLEGVGSDTRITMQIVIVSGKGDNMQEKMQNAFAMARDYFDYYDIDASATAGAAGSKTEELRDFIVDWSMVSPISNPQAVHYVCFQDKSSSDMDTDFLYSVLKQGNFTDPNGLTAIGVNIDSVDPDATSHGVTTPFAFVATNLNYENCMYDTSSAASTLFKVLPPQTLEAHDTGGKKLSLGEIFAIVAGVLGAGFIGFAMAGGSIKVFGSMQQRSTGARLL